MLMPLHGRLCLAFALLGTACRSTALTKELAGSQLTHSTALSGVDNLTFGLPRGCYTLGTDELIKATDLDRDTRLREDSAVRTLLQRERDLELLEFEFVQAPASQMTPLEGCEVLWASFHNGGSDDRASRTKLVAWKTYMSEKAQAAGFQPGVSYVYRRQTLESIDSLESLPDGSTIVKYRWRWAPTDEGRFLGIKPTEPTIGTARFVRADGEWRLAAR
jgi:hypothetical protein